MKALLDINVVLDVLFGRAPWYADAAQVWDAHRNGLITAAIAAFTVPTLFYVVRRQTDLAHAHAAVQVCLTTLQIVSIHRSTLEYARTLPGNDFEDNLQLACAVEGQMDCLVTRDPKGFSAASVPVFTPADLLALLAKANP